MDKIAILDFGSQTTQLISRRLREKSFYTEIFPGDAELSAEMRKDLKGIIFSGSPESVYDTNAPTVHSSIYDAGIPILGICYGFQRMTQDHGGKVAPLSTREYGRNKINFVGSSLLFEGIPDGFVSWMSHGDSIEQAADGFEVIATSENHIAAGFHKKKNFYGIQFHPEVTHCEHGIEILVNFASGICKAVPSWSMQVYLEEQKEKIRAKVGSSTVLLLISGGVDSTVVGAMLLKILNPSQVHLMYVDTGMMRKGESAEVETALKNLGATHLHIIDAKERFLKALKGKSEPEEKRRIIGDMFIHVQQEEVRNKKIGEGFLAQGTLYTDLIESGKGVGKKAHVIKSHHNVRSPLVEAKRESGLIIEPIDHLYKDEVRALGRLLGLPENIIGRHPFPGPGLGVRILGEVTQEKADILREADFIYISELKSRGLYDQIWQAFSVLLPVRSVGVAGDVRAYGYVLALRAVVSHDGMTADVYPFPMHELLEISNLITNKVKAIGRVVYDISSKPPSTIEWE